MNFYAKMKVKAVYLKYPKCLRLDDSVPLKTNSEHLEIRLIVIIDFNRYLPTNLETSGIYGLHISVTRNTIM